MGKSYLILLFLVVSSLAFESIDERFEETESQISDLAKKYDHLDGRLVTIYNGMFKLDVTSWAHKIFVILSMPLNWLVTFIIIRLTIKNDVLMALSIYNSSNPVLEGLPLIKPKKLGNQGLSIGDIDKGKAIPDPSPDTKTKETKKQEIKLDEKTKHETSDPKQVKKKEKKTRRKAKKETKTSSSK